MKKIYTAALFVAFTLPCLIYGVWNSPVTEFSGGATSSYEYVASDPAGNAITIWADNDLPGVYGAYFSATTQVYGSPQLIYSGNSAQELRLAMDATGTAVGIWYVGFTGEIITGYFDGSTWSIPTPNPLDTSGIFAVGVYPSIAMDGSGNAVAAWIDTTTSSVRTSQFTPISWTAPTTIGTGTDTTSIAYSANGAAAVIWNNAGTLNASNYILGAWQAPVALGATLVDGAVVGMDAAGNALAVWLDNPTGNVFTSRFNGNIWSVAQPLSLATNTQVDLAVAPGGTAVAIWVDNAGNGFYSAFNGTSWGPPVLFATGVVADELFQPSENTVSVATDSAGNALIVWGTTSEQILSVRLPVGGVLAVTELVSPFVEADVGTGGLTVIQGALSDNGRGFVSWSERFDAEDFSSFGTFSLFPPTPPGGIEGFICRNKFATATDRIHVIVWTPSTDPTVTAYSLQRNGVVIATLPATGPYIFYDHNRCKNQPDTYTVTAVGPTGESTPLTIILQ